MRREPPASDEWRPKHRYRKRRYGLQIDRVLLFGKQWRYTLWYVTPKNREEGRRRILTKHWLEILNIKNVERK